LTCVCAQTNRSSLAKTIQIDHAHPLSTKKVLLHALTFSPFSATSAAIVPSLLLEGKTHGLTD